MPGIAGVLAPMASPAHEQRVRRMAATLRHQPASSSGELFVPELGVYGAWVAHARSQAARQSSGTADSSIGLMFAGTSFDAEAVGGTSLRSRYAMHGEACIAQLNGLFAGLLVDRTRGQALLFNDRYGSERLYVSESEGALYFASEAKALLAVLPALRAFDELGVAQFLAFGSTRDGTTLFKDVRLLPGGSLLRHRRGVPPQRERYFVPAQWESLQPLEGPAFEAAFAETFTALLPRYLSGNAQVGLSLTGGLDTRMIVACLPADGPAPALAYTYAAEGSDALLDLCLARRIAGMRHLPHHALRIGAGFLGDFARQVDRTVHVTDGCAGVLGAHEIGLSAQARALAPVRLTGNFGSEVLRSMTTFRRSGLDRTLLDPALAERVDEVEASQHERHVHPVTHAAFEEVPWHLYGTLAACRSQLEFRTPYLDNAVVELAYRAPPQLRQSAAPALRLIHRRDPALARLPTDRALAWGPASPLRRLRRMAGNLGFKLDYWHKEGLPDALHVARAPLDLLARAGLLGRHKFLAWRPWFRDALAPHAAQVTGDARTARMPFWNLLRLRAIAAEHAGGRHNRLRELHAVLTLEAVQRNLLDASAHAGATNPNP